MIPLGRIGMVKKGPLTGWFIQVQEMELPKGILVSRARNATMDQTVVLDGIFPDWGKLETFFEANAPEVDWDVKPAKPL
jgi:hypothetical protein